MKIRHKLEYWLCDWWKVILSATAYLTFFICIFVVAWSLNQQINQWLSRIDKLLEIHGC